MAKFFGRVGYSEGSVESPPDSGIWVEVIVEHEYYGDILRNTRQLQQGDHLNKDLSVLNQISIVADAYANDHFSAIRYVEWMGALWTVTDVEVQAPRLLLSLGEVYNGPEG